MVSTQRLSIPVVFTWQVFQATSSNAPSFTAKLSLLPSLLLLLLTTKEILGARYAELNQFVE